MFVVESVSRVIISWNFSGPFFFDSTKTLAKLNNSSICDQRTGSYLERQESCLVTCTDFSQNLIATESYDNRTHLLHRLHETQI